MPRRPHKTRPPFAPDEQPSLEIECNQFNTLLQTALPAEMKGRQTVLKMFADLCKRVRKLDQAYQDVQLQRAKELRAQTLWNLFEKGVSQVEIASILSLHKEHVSRALRQMIKEKTGSDLSPLQYRNQQRGIPTAPKPYTLELQQLEAGASTLTHEKHVVGAEQKAARAISSSLVIEEPPTDEEWREMQEAARAQLTFTS